MNWRYRALCRGEDTELFFPIGTTGPAERQIEAAKAMCRRCAVRVDCLNWAFRTGQDSGIWGGLSEEERRALRRDARASPSTALRLGQALAPATRQADHVHLMAGGSQVEG